MSLSRKTALVTGSSRGLGRGMAVRLAREGALVAVHGRDTDAASQTVKEIEAVGGQAFAIMADLGEVSGVTDMVTQLRAGLDEWTGEPGLDILVNCAGFSSPTAFDTVRPTTFDALMAVNARAALFTIQQTLPFLRDNGRIINISSALTRFAWVDEVAFAMSKAAVEQLALHLARHLGPRGITINTVAPGPTDNGHLPISNDPDLAAEGNLSAFGRFGTITDIADIVAFLAAPEARWITGAWIDATGGVLA
jgi:NAD(P)-dependent dehydrogenase (short-subunit alcohol dehydrogenase family)